MLSWIEDQRPTETSFWSKLRDLLKGTSQNDALLRDAETAAGVDQPQKLSVAPIAQHYHPDRTLIHDQINSMRSSNLTVAVEQVSIFLTNDGTVITFFQVFLQGNCMLSLAIGESSRETYCPTTWFGKYYSSNLRRSLFTPPKYHRCSRRSLFPHRHRLSRINSRSRIFPHLQSLLRKLMFSRILRWHILENSISYQEN
jgi:hypothetical protein